MSAPAAETRALGALEATVVVAAVALLPPLLVYSLASVATQLGASPRAASQFVTTQPLVGGLVQAAVGLALVAIARRLGYLRAPIVADLAMTRPGGRNALLGLAAGVSMQFPLAELANYVARVAPLPFEGEMRLARLLTPEGPLAAVALLVSVGLLAPITEEVVFRGLLLRGTTRTMGSWGSVLVSTVGFGIAHGHPVYASVATAGGLVLALVVRSSGSLVTAVVAHGASNTLPVLLQLAGLTVTGVTPLAKGPVAPALVALGTLGVAASVAAMREVDSPAST